MNSILNRIYLFCRQHRTYLLVLSVMVVFVTTYVLILPAITLDEEEAMKQGGINLTNTEQTETRDLQENGTAEGDAADPKEAEPADSDNTSADNDVDASSGKQADDEAESGDDAKAGQPDPATSESAELLAFAGEGLSITAECGKDANLPADTQMTAQEIPEEDEYYEGYLQEALKAVQEKDGKKKASAFSFIRFYDITLNSGDETVQPEEPVDVTISYEEPVKAADQKKGDAENIRIVRFGADKEGNLQAEVLDLKKVTAVMKEDKLQETEFPAESFSVYAVAYISGTSDADEEVSEDAEEKTEKETVEYSDSDGSMTVTAVAPAGTLPEGATVHIREILPFDENGRKAAEEEARMYSDALTAVADTMRKSNMVLSGARVCDIYFEDASGKEIEPEGNVDVSVSFADGAGLTAEEKNTESGIAHIQDNGKAEVLDAKIETADNGEINEAAFTSDEFSVYVVFNGNPDNQTSEPVYLNDGWIRVGGDYEKATSLPDGTHGANDENGWKNYLRVNVYTLRAGRPQNSTNPDDYTRTSTFQWVAGYDTLTIEDYKFPGQVVFTQFHPADRDPLDPTPGLERGQEFPARTAFHNWSEDAWEVFDNELNIYVNTTEPTQPAQRTEYVIRYYHADGTYDEKTGMLTNGQSLSFGPEDKMRSNELYSGLTIGTGNAAFSRIDTAAGTGTFGYNSNIHLVKANIYYKEKIESKNGGRVSIEPPYDTMGSGSSKVYDTYRMGLHTDKTAEVTSNSQLNDGRTFDLTLESWNVGQNLANVGMVLDASGSMVWTSDTPTPLVISAEERRRLGLQTNRYLTPAQVNQILDIRNTDSSRLSYNGYKYYIKDTADGVKEYVPLGYFDGNSTRTTEEGKYYFYATSNGASLVYNNGQNPVWPTAGWYYVNSSDSTRYKNHGTAKSYCNYPDNQTNKGGGTASQFYIKSDGTLHCEWHRTPSGQPTEWESDVYVFANDGDTKSEVLQNSIARFASFMSALSPQSQIAMTRFSRNNFNSSDLPLLNWTNDPAKITAALNQTYGGGTSTGTETQYSANNTALTVYNYGFTGGTSTQTGINAYIQSLTNNRYGTYTPKTTNNAASKYLIIFTDGKDTDTNSSASTYATNLKNSGYTIITVLMQSASMEGTELTDAQAFLHGLAGKTGENGYTRDADGEYKYYFSAMYNEPEELAEAFLKIAKQIAQPLDGYMIRDYIDPRFDIVDNEGNVLTQLNPQGYWSPRTIDTADGKRALLKYDSDKGMFYIEIEEQTIPTVTQNATDHITVNTTTITVRAKEDFLGGEDILTNGNGEGDNSVFKPDGTIHADEPTPAVPTADHKDFPKTTANPATLNITLSNYEDTIFLGEEISPSDLFDAVQVKRDQGTDHRGLYFDYLTRAGQKLRNDPDYYVNILKSGGVPPDFVPLSTNPETITPITEGGKITGITLTLPYYYLEDEDDLTSYAGGALHQADKVGSITYTWKATDTGDQTLTDDNALNDYDADTLDTVRYHLSVSYSPDDFMRNDNVADNGSARTLALTNQTGNSNLIRDPVGPAAQDQSTGTDQGLAAIHVVAGKMKIKKRIEMSESDWNALVAKAGSDGLEFTFALKKDGETYGDPITLSSSDALVNGNYIEISSDWITELPQGDYTIEETGAPPAFEFESVSADTVINTDGDGGTGGVQFAAPSQGSVTWKIGQVSGGTPAACTYADTDFSAAKVRDANKEVDPEKDKKYLNAQIGKGIVLNKLIAANITLKKVDKDNLDDNSAELLPGAKFTITKYTDNTFSVVDTSASAWSMTLEDVEQSGTYTLNGTFTFTGLPVGFFRVDEEVMPEGYVKTEEDPVFEVRKNASTSQLEIVLYKKSGNTYTEVSSGSTDMARIAAGNTLFIGNVSGVALPDSGGPGTAWIYILGAVLLLGGSILLIARRRIRTE